MAPSHHVGKFLPKTKGFFPHDFTLIASVDYAAATASVVLKCPILTLHGDRTTLPRLGVGVVIALLEKLSRLA